MGKYSLLIGCVLLFTSVVGYVQWMKTYEKKVTTTPVLVASKYIPAHTRIDESMLEWIQSDIHIKREDAWHGLKDVIGKESAVPIGTGEQFLKWKMDTRGLVPNPGEQFFTFKTDSIATVSNMVRRGDEVQIWLEVDPNLVRADWPGMRLTELPGAMKVLSFVKIAYVRDAQGQEVVSRSQQLSPIVLSKSNDEVRHEQERLEATGDIVSVTYILTEEQYEKLLRAQRYGRLKMGLSYSFGALPASEVSEERGRFWFDDWMRHLSAPAEVSQEKEGSG